jgi:hypothetical protein
MTRQKMTSNYYTLKRFSRVINANVKHEEEVCSSGRISDPEKQKLRENTLDVLIWVKEWIDKIKANNKKMKYTSGYCPVCLHTECKCWQIFNQGHFNKTTIQTPSEGGEGSGGKKNINTNDPKPNIDIPQVLHKTHVIRSQPCPEHKLNRLPYLEFVDDAERRIEAGQQQKQCSKCLLWLWEDEF